MDKAVRRALEGSIRKWEGIVANGKTDDGPCDLCDLFADPENLPDAGWCVGCPVMARTGQANCEGSPYWAWRRLFINGPDDEVWDNSFPRRARTEEQATAAQAELEFLRSLRRD